MILGHTFSPNTYAHLISEGPTNMIFDWLMNTAANLEDGEYELDKRNIYASIFTKPTVSRGDGTFEAHREYIDIHYCLDGNERIEWAPAEQLEITRPYDKAKDVTLYETPERATSLLMTPGTFAIFLPGEAHMPIIQVTEPEILRKVVVKCSKDLIL